MKLVFAVELHIATQQLAYLTCWYPCLRRRCARFADQGSIDELTISVLHAPNAYKISGLAILYRYLLDLAKAHALGRNCAFHRSDRPCLLDHVQCLAALRCISHLWSYLCLTPLSPNRLRSSCGRCTCASGCTAYIVWGLERAGYRFRSTRRSLRLSATTYYSQFPI